MKIRIKFSKQGPIRFIGHLDVMRYFQKVMRRADVDIKYSEGFSPHQIMSFASPLSVGLTSRGEYMDIEVNSTKDSQTMLQAINAVNVEGIRVLSYRLLDDSAKNAMSQVAAADYCLWFKDDYRSEHEATFFRDFLAFLESPAIEVVKETKKGEKTVDLKPYIYEARLAGTADHTGKPEDRPGVFLKLSAGSSVNVKPEQLLTAFGKTREQELSPFAIQVEREEVYAAADGTEKDSMEKDSMEKDSVEKGSMEKDSMEKGSMEKGSMEEAENASKKAPSFIPLEEYGREIEAGTIF